MRLHASIQHDLIPHDAQVLRLRARTGLSRLFAVEALFVCTDPDLDLDALLWTGALCRVDDRERPGGDADPHPLLLHGVIESAEFVHSYPTEHRAVYRVVLRPLLHGLAHRARSRLFQNLSAVDIVKQVLRETGVPDDAVVWGTSVEYPVREVCVQYRESDLAFVLRLLEDEGIFYWFAHSEAGHVLHLGDGPTAHEPLTGGAALPHTRVLEPRREGVTELVYAQKRTHDAHRSRDWNFERPGSPLDGAFVGAEAPVFERHEYPGGFNAASDGMRRSTNRHQESNARARTLRGRTNCRRCEPGRKFTLADARPAMLCDDYVLLEVAHSYEEPAWFGADGALASGAARGARGAVHYDATFVAAPASAPFRPARKTPKPRVLGVESAVVTGPAGEEIHVDQYGRVKVRFYWDREHAPDDTASFWIRTQQLNTTGSAIMPRVGWEVSVGFLDGDPDRPVVLQKLYNDEQKPPYPLPANKTQGSLQTSSSPGGGGTNEVRLQDGAGGMEFFVHAQRDYHLVAGHDVDERVDVDAHEETVVNQSLNVGTTETLAVGANQSVSVTGVCALETVGSKTVSVDGSDTWGATKNYSVTVGGARSDTIGSMMNVLANKVDEVFKADCSRTVGAAFCINSATAIVETVGGSKTEMVGAAKLELVRKSKSEEVKGSKTLASGLMKETTRGDVQYTAKAAYAINVGGPVVIKCGDGYTVSGRLVALTTASLEMKAGGSSLKAQGKLTLKASSLGASGGPILQLKGRINYKP